MSREPIYLINPVPDRFRWVAVKENDDDWGLRLARLQNTVAGVDFGPVPVEWAPETINRPGADFLNFRSNLLCIRSTAKAILAALLSPCGEWIALDGLEGGVSCFHCLETADALDHERTDALLHCSVYGSFHSPKFVPALHARKLVTADIFRIPQSVSKLFVSSNFKSIYDRQAFSGLEFFEVELT